jgi:hypothetical protein
VVLVFKGSNLDLIHERLIGALFPLGRFFRDDHPYRDDPWLHEANTIRRRFGEIDDAALGVGIRSPIRDLHLHLFPSVPVLDHDLRAQRELAVGCRHLILREAFPIGGFAAVKVLAII